MAKIHKFELTIAVEVEVDDYAEEYGMDGTEEATRDDAVSNIAAMLNEVVDEKARQMGYFTAYLRDTVAEPRH